MARRTVVVTGGSSGIGLAAAVALAGAGDEVVLVGRQQAKLARAADRVTAVAGRPPRTYRADFARLAEVRQLADRLRADLSRIDVLVNNAGQLAPRTRATVDGHDVTMQVNHLGGFLLSQLLLDRLRAAAGPAGPARIVTTGSLAEAWGPLDVDRPAAPVARYRGRWLAYGASKQANLLFTVEAARRFAPLGVVPTCFFPGLVQTRFGRSSLLFSLAKSIPLLFRTPEQGADTLVWLATDDEALVPGGYFAFRAPFAATPRSTDPDRARRLWSASLRAVGLPAVSGPQ
ncbi:SDR family NAD(P)-dependent oxidoreductase [Polymorphospora rubra]|uniref:SDR family NAD(P)-dependent oxidoreductase n=1 Tax=Polymorphospora rubra TaxID=338584 RepID=UPI0033C8E8AB